MRPRRFQFGLRTLMLTMLVSGMLPWIAVRCWQWREDRIWTAHYAAKQQRDQALVSWRTVYDGFVRQELDAAAEAKAREKYWTARKEVEQTVKTLRSFYGDSPANLQRAVQSRPPSVAPKGP